MIRIGIGFTIVSYLALLVVLITCSVPHDGEGGWSGVVFIRRVGAQATQITVAIGAVGTFTDFYVFLIPLIVVCGLNLSRGRKIGLCTLFATGLLYVLPPFLPHNGCLFSLYYNLQSMRLLHS